MKNIVSLVLALGFVGTAAMAQDATSTSTATSTTTTKKPAAKHRTHRTVRKHTTKAAPAASTSTSTTTSK